MNVTETLLNDVYDRTDGDCHLCGKRLAFRNYGTRNLDMVGARGHWEPDHVKPSSRGGSDRLPNLLPACISCNRSRQDRPYLPIRKRNGAPSRVMSRRGKEAVQVLSAMSGLAGGASVGYLLAGSRGALLGALGGAALGATIDPKRARTFAVVAAVAGLGAVLLRPAMRTRCCRQDAGPLGPRAPTGLDRPSLRRPANHSPL